MTILEDVNEILFTKWDPIGVRGVAPADEYMSIAVEIIELCGDEADPSQIAKFLAEKRTQDMMIEMDKSTDARAAKEIAAVINARKVQ
ncbi:hypothetical protein [Rhizobium sp. ZPR3]|uniref:DUF1871 family protein n=2 Tax=unclassified Rhizobium TaxID=2613769 RepID=A0AAU7SQE3_9HYPH